MTDLEQLRSYLADMQAQIDSIKVEIALLVKAQEKEETPMYNRSRHGSNWYMAAFWLTVGILIGQFLRFDIDLAPREGALPAQVQTASK